MSNEDIAIAVRNLTKTYRLFGHPGDRVKQFLSFGLKRYHRNFTALKDVSFDIKKGETVGIIGRNGSGKSTLLQLICGILKPTSGSVEVYGRVSALLELGAGFNPEFTGRENVYFQGALMGLTKEKMDARFDEIAAFASIGEFIDQPVRTYSSGMFVRLAFSVAVHVDPDILVVDEALAVGDLAFQSKCLEKMNELQASGLSIILVTHAHAIVAGLCSRAIQLSKGCLALHGTPAEVLSAYEEELVESERQFVRSRNQNVTGIQIREVNIFDQQGRERSHFHMHESITIQLAIVSESGINHPCFGMEIRGPNGFALWSATSESLEIPLPRLSSRRPLRIQWQFPADIAPGTYMLALGAGEISHGHYQRHDRRHQAAEITILGARGIHGYLPLRPTIQILDGST